MGQEHLWITALVSISILTAGLLIGRLAQHGLQGQRTELPGLRRGLNADGSEIPVDACTYQHKQ